MPEITPSHWHDESRVKACITCGEDKVLSDFYAYGYTTNQGNRSTRYESRCKPCARERRKARYESIGEHERASHRNWLNENRDHVSAYSKERQKCPIHRALKAKSQRMRKARIRAGTTEQTGKIRAIYAEAMRVEREIADCPVFDIPELGKKIHVDHITPLAAGGQHTAGNLQLLPAGINLRKGVQCPR